MLEQQSVPSVNYSRLIPPHGTRSLLIFTINWVNPVHMLSQDPFIHFWWDTFPLLK